MALMTTLFFSIYAVIVRFNRQVDMLPAILISTVLIMAMTGLTQRGVLPISKDDLWLCLLWGGVMSGFTSASFIVASRHIIAAELTIFMLLEFALGPVWVWLFVNEIPSKWTLAGGCLLYTSPSPRDAHESRMPSSA